MKRHPNRIVEIHVHKSKKNPRLGHAVAILFPCNHNRYLGYTLYRGEPDTIEYRTQLARIIKFEDYEVMEKSTCKLCPYEVEWLDDLVPQPTLDDLADVLEAIDDL